MTNLNTLRTCRNLFVSFKCKHKHILNLNACKKPVFSRYPAKAGYFQQKQRPSFKAGDSSWSRLYWKLIILIKQREISYVNRSQDMSRIDRSKHSHSLFRNTQLQQFSFWLHPSTRTISSTLWVLESFESPAPATHWAAPNPHLVFIKICTLHLPGVVVGFSSIYWELPVHSRRKHKPKAYDEELQQMGSGRSFCTTVRFYPQMTALFFAITYSPMEDLAESSMYPQFSLSSS